MAVIPRPSLSGGLESMSLGIEGTDISRLDDGSPRETTRSSRGRTRSDVGENGTSGWHCWLMLLVGEGRGDERNEQPVEARLLSNPPSPCHQSHQAPSDHHGTASARPGQPSDLVGSTSAPFGVTSVHLGTNSDHRADDSTNTVTTQSRHITTIERLTMPWDPALYGTR
jgi:hypothetical protein